MKSLLSILAIIPLMATAHVEDGVWEGQTEAGAPCQMNAIKTYFDGTLKHPLTERVEIDVNGLKFILQHPAIIDETKPSASFDHDQFKGVLPHSTGANALVLKMTHTKSYEGPTEYYFISHDYKNATSSVIKCAQLKKI